MPQKQQKKTNKLLGQLVAQGMQHHSAGRRDQAQACYEQVLAQAPKHPDALHLTGLLAAQGGDFERAQTLIWQAITANPNEAMFHNNLGNVCVELRQMTAAEAMYARAIELDPMRMDALSNLGALLSKSDRAEQAEPLLKRAVELAPNNSDWRQNLANHYMRQGRKADALTQCHEAMIFAPRNKALRSLLIMAYNESGHPELAAKVLRAWINEEPDNPIPRHQLAACTDDPVPARASDDYVALLFDEFAQSFDAKLADLSYQAPALVAAEATRRHSANKSLDVLDAGCGTGLCGPLLAPFARALTGVDLSEGMLRQAAARTVYDNIYQGELVAFLAEQTLAYDLVVAADVLCYFGDLSAFCVNALAALRPGGSLIFTVESHGDEPKLPDFHLRGNGRYSQSRRYVDAALRDAGWHDVLIQPVVLRNEGGRPVDGWLVSAQRAGGG